MGREWDEHPHERGLGELPRLLLVKTRREDGHL